MNEEIETEGEEEPAKAPAVPKVDRDKPETTPLIDRANKTREGLDAANKKFEELIDRQEKLMAKKELGGSAEAGLNPPVPKEETDEEYAQKALNGELSLEE